ncbi:MAG: hypothetical protein RIR79_965 [Pseudomonadota bacterium]
MGFFSSLAHAIKTTNEEVHGQRLLEHLQSTFQMFNNLPLQMRTAIGAGYLQIRTKIDHEMINWTPEGRIRIGRKMQEQARASFDVDMVGSYAKWMAGAWLESGERNSVKAKIAFEMLDMFEQDLIKSFNELNRQQEKIKRKQDLEEDYNVYF